MESNEQPELFAEGEWPEQPALLSAAKQYLVTGTTAVRDEERAMEICKALASQISQRAIARRYQVSRNTIRRIWELMRERGKLEPLIKELGRDAAYVAKLGFERMAEALEEGAVQPQFLPAFTGVATDKFLLLNGFPSSIVAHKREVAAEDVEEAFRRLRLAATAPADPPPSDAPAPASEVPEIVASDLGSEDSQPNTLIDKVL